MGWLLLKKRPEVIAAGQKVDIRDLTSNPFVRLNKALDPWFNWAVCFGLPMVVGWLLDEPWQHSLFFSGLLRYISLLHATWSVNSFVHMVQIPMYRPYRGQARPCESAIVSLLALGEGWHSWFDGEGATDDFMIQRSQPDDQEPGSL